MTTYNTGNPIGSTDSRDRLDNTENMDYLENSTTKLTHPDRLGTVRKTRHGMEVEHDNQISAHESEHDAQMQSFENDFDGRLAGMAFTRVGSFTSGATLTDMRQVLIWEVSQGGDGHEYGWTGAFPKGVAAGATPETTGGIGAGAWVDRTDLTLRGDINIVVKRFNSVADMVSDTTLSIGQIVETLGYYINTSKGGANYIIVEGGTGTEDGGSYITLSNGLQAKALFKSRCNAYHFGAKFDGATDDTLAIQNRINYSPYGVFRDVTGTTSITSITLQDNTDLSGSGDSLVVNVASGNIGFTATSKSNLRIRKFKVVGDGSFSEHKHLFKLNGVTNVIIEDITAVNPQGDHIYLGAGDSSDLNNYNVKVINSRFTGNGVGGRNAISVIDVDVLEVSGNNFDNCGSYGMPGDIDLEPNTSSAVLKNIYIHHNNFKNSVGSVGMIGIIVNVGTITQSNYSNINIHNNTFNTPTTNSCADLRIDFNTTSWTDDETLPIINVYDNESIATKIPHYIYSAPYLRLRRNSYKNQQQASLIGPRGDKGSIYRIDIKDEYVDGATASTITYGWRFCGFSKLRIESCVFGAIGNGTENSAPIAFVNGESDVIEIINNEFTDTSGASNKHVYQYAHTFTKASNITRGNRFVGVKVFDVPAYDNDGPQEFNNGYDANVLPSVLPNGITMSLINTTSGSGLPTGYTQGELITYKGLRATGFTRQEFHSRDDTGGTLKSVKLFRTSARSTDAWESWYKLTGTAVS